MLDFFIQTFQVKCLDGDALPIPVAKALTAAAAVSSSSFWINTDWDTIGFEHQESKKLSA